MKYTLGLQLILVISLIAIQGRLTNGYASYVKNIPNGANIPNPCSPGTTWIGVGHTIPAGGGGISQFGVDYKKAGSWNRYLCQLDSDGDGMTNGAELGDPNCQWTVGQADPTGSTIYNPAVCESSTCSQGCGAVTSSGGDSSEESSESDILSSGMKNDPCHWSLLMFFALVREFI